MSRKCTASGVDSQGKPWKCDKPYLALGYCAAHRRQFLLGRDPLTPARPRRPGRSPKHYVPSDDLFGNGIPPGHKTCTNCEQVKPFSAFTKYHMNKDGLRHHCKECVANVSMQHVYAPGVVEHKARQLAEQGDVCAICGTDTPHGKGGWHQDHDHALSPHDPESWRGVLCAACNFALGIIEKWEGHHGMNAYRAKWRR